MQQESSKAIVLRSFFFQEHRKIATIFSEQFGILSLVMKKGSSGIQASLSQPFSEGEFFFTKGSSDLRKYQDGSILDLHLALRESLSYLQTASQISKALLSTQMPEKPSPSLYALFSLFLKQIPSFSSQETLLTCFYIKLLRHEGLYHPQKSLPLCSDNERELLAYIALIQSFDALRKEEISPSLALRVQKSFEEIFS